jgi:hypothetical protein
MVDFSRNEKQKLAFYEVMKAVKGLTPYRFFALGGAVRGGKTFFSLGMLVLLCKMFPKSRWHIVRKDFTVLQGTTIPSIKKICPPNKGSWRYKERSGDFHLLFENGSCIYFMGENFSRDKDLTDFLGLETNGFLLEQGEELTRRLVERAKERAGSWYIDPMPPPLIFMTFNPTDEWPRELVYDPYMDGGLQAPWMFIEMLPNHNPYVTEEQWSMWNQMDEVDYRRMILGDWDSQRRGGEFYHKFSRARHTKLVEINPDSKVAHLTFDQNVNPYITLNCWQFTYLPNGYVSLTQFDEIHLAHPLNDTESVCNEFMERYGHIFDLVFLYGDASGRKRSTNSKVTDYDIAKRVLAPLISSDSDRTNRYNQNVPKRRGFINNLFDGKYTVEIWIDSDKCRNTIIDYTKLKVDTNGSKLKETTKDVNGVTYEKYGHPSDANDYFFCTVLEWLWSEYLNK